MHIDYVICRRLGELTPWNDQIANTSPPYRRDLRHALTGYGCSHLMNDH
jgi:hypothetical protein